MREENILSWLKYHRNSGQICRKNKNNLDPKIEFLNFPDESQEEAEVDETAMIGHLVSIISVTDLDLEDRGRALVNITEGNEEGHFRVDSVGDVHVVRVAGRGQLDRETTSQYQLTVQAEDRGTPPRTSTATLTVNVRGKRYYSNLTSIFKFDYISVVTFTDQTSRRKLCTDPGWTTQAETSVEVKMTRIMERMMKLEADLVAKDQRIAVLEDDKKVKDQRIANMTADIALLKANVTRDITQLKSKKFAVQCAWKDSTWSADNSVITFDHFTHNEISGGSGGLDINTGVFAVGDGLSGVWAVTYSIRSRQDSGGDQNWAWLYKNDEPIKESFHFTRYSGSEGQVESLGSRSLYKRLEAGDTISLRTGTIRYVYDINLCFELVHSDD